VSSSSEYISYNSSMGFSQFMTGRALVEEFKKGLNKMIRRRLVEAESPPSTISD